MESDKVSPQLAEHLQDNRGDDWLDVIVELADPSATDAAGPTRAEKIAARKEGFARQAEPVAELIRRLGGEVTGQAWINSSIRARLAKKMIPALSAESRISRLDVPHMIKADAS